MIALLACCLALSTYQQDGQVYAKTDLPALPNSQVTPYLLAFQEPLEPAHLSPKKFGADGMQWPFPWMVGAMAHVQGQINHDDMKFVVYAQEQKGKPAVSVARMYVRLWEFNLERLKLIHNPAYHRGIVDVYVCFGGSAGGEQLLGTEIGPDNKLTQVNTIYLYDMASFTEPVEMAREVAHEYGHASWPHFGGFKQPEQWAEGYLAEKVYLVWLRDAIARNELTPDDAMGATKDSLDKWISAHVDPLVMMAAQVLPTPELISEPNENGMNAFLGIALYVERLYPTSVFARSLKLGSYSGKDYPDSAVLAAEEPAQVTLKIPPQLRGKAIWIPLGTGKLRGAPILKRAPSGWVQIQVGVNPVIVDNAH